jgi:ABC-type multidrug transport system ATPase subunit
MDLLSEFNSGGTTVIIVTHSLRLVADYCNYSVLLSKGEKAAEGNPRDLLFQDMPGMTLPPLLELSRLMKGNALSLKEFLANLKGHG